MNTLYPLVKSLSPAEVKGIRAELKMHRAQSKSLKLFEILMKSTAIPEESIVMSKLSGVQSSSKRLKYVIKQLKSKILDYLVSDKNLEEKKNGMYREVLRSHKKYLQLQYLHFYKPGQPLIFELLNDVISISKEYESYTILATALNFSKNVEGLRIGPVEFEQRKREYWHCIEMQNGARRAAELYHELSIIKTFYGTVAPDVYLNFLEKSIFELKLLYELTSSANVAYYLKYFEIENAEQRNDYNAAIKAGFEKIEIIKSNKSIFEEKRIGIAYDDIGASFVMLNQFSDAIIYIKEAQQFFKKGTYNYWCSKSLEYATLFYDKRYKEALLGFKELKETLVNTKVKFFFDKVVCHYNYCLFSSKEYSKVIKELSLPLEISKDKTGWDIAMRVLMIMTLVELERLDEASLHVERLRKHVARYGKTGYITPRNLTIVKLLQALNTNGFVFDTAHPRIAALLDELKAPGQAWKPLTPELIPFEEWVIAHA